MNITIALDDELVARAREIARAQGTTLNEMVRRHLESIAGTRPATRIVEELTRLWDEYPGHSGGASFRREDAYKGRV